MITGAAKDVRTRYRCLGSRGGDGLLLPTLLFGGGAQPAGERLRLPDMQPAAECECALSPRLTQTQGQAFDLPHLVTKGLHIVAGSQGRAQDDEIMIVAQFCLEAFQITNQ